MKALILASQLIVPQIPADISETEIFKGIVSTYSCVEAIEEDSVVHTTSIGGDSVSVARLLVAVKPGKDVKACANQIVKEVDGLKLESTFIIIPAFVISHELSTKN